MSTLYHKYSAPLNSMRKRIPPECITIASHESNLYKLLWVTKVKYLLIYAHTLIKGQQPQLPDSSLQQVHPSGHSWIRSGHIIASREGFSIPAGFASTFLSHGIVLPAFVVHFPPFTSHLEPSGQQ